MKLHRTVGLALVVVLAACTPNISPDTYSVGSVGQVNRAVVGTIISARPVDVEGTRTGIGAGAGAIAGGAAGSTVGGNTQMNIIGAVGGALVAGVIGAAAEEEMTRQTGIEYVIETTNGAILTIVQGDDTPLLVGQKVLVIYGQRSRVIPYTGEP